MASLCEQLPIQKVAVMLLKAVCQPSLTIREETALLVFYWHASPTVINCPHQLYTTNNNNEQSECKAYYQSWFVN